MKRKTNFPKFAVLGQFCKFEMGDNLQIKLVVKQSLSSKFARELFQLKFGRIWNITYCNSILPKFARKLITTQVWPNSQESLFQPKFGRIREKIISTRVWPNL